MTTPAAFRRGLTDHARRRAKATGAAVNALVEQFLYDRLLARVFSREPDGWLLKNGQVLLRRYPDARTTRDLDLLAQHDKLEGAVARLRVAAALDLGDFTRFEYLDATSAVEGSRTTRVRFDVYFGSQRTNAVSVDIAAGRQPRGVPAVRRLEPCIPGTEITDWPEVVLYPIVDHAADKICAMYERHGVPPVRTSTRFRDLADRFVSPLLQNETPGVWDPDGLSWSGVR